MSLVKRPLPQWQMKNGKQQMADGRTAYTAGLFAMTKPIRRILFLSALTAIICNHASAVAQNKLWREIKWKPLVKFDWNCAVPSIYPKAKLSRLVEVAQR